MINGYVTALSGVLLAVSTVQSSAGPCSQQIHDVRVAAENRLDAIAGAGKTGAETPAATMHRQPTPSSVAGAEAKLGELSSADAEAYSQAMQRAETDDENGDLSDCEQALSEAQRILERKP
jgi:predicted lipid-binding transport protein (Tim44 family)